MAGVQIKDLLYYHSQIVRNKREKTLLHITKIYNIKETNYYMYKNYINKVKIRVFSPNCNLLPLSLLNIGGIAYTFIY